MGLGHDPLLRDIFTPLTVGATLHVPPQEFIRKPVELNAWLREHRITVSHWTPSLCRMICSGQRPGFTLPDLRYSFFGGEVLRLGQVVALRRLAPLVQAVNCYGATETPQIVAYHVVRATNEAEVVPLDASA